jgi:hypothetical protein
VQVLHDLHGLTCHVCRALSCLLLKLQPAPESKLSKRFKGCVQALEGLPGADGLEAYEFVSRRTGGWDDERRRLQKEGDKRSRLASRVKLCMHQHLC